MIEAKTSALRLPGLPIWKARRPTYHEPFEQHDGMCWPRQGVDLIPHALGILLEQREPLWGAADSRPSRGEGRETCRLDPRDHRRLACKGDGMAGNFGGLGGGWA
jgi:hypothetical protein